MKRQVWETSPGLCLYNFVDNHDEDRLASKLHNPAHLFTVYAMLFTLPGIPSIYYGSEWGIPGRRTRESDEALRPSFSAADARANASPLTDYIRTLADIHASHPAFHHGSYQEILLTNRQYAYLREGGGERTLCAFHIDTQAGSLSLPSFDQGDEALDLLTNESFPVTDGRFSVPMGPCQARIFIQTRKGA